VVPGPSGHWQSCHACHACHASRAAPASVVKVVLNPEHWVRALRALTSSCSLLAVSLPTDVEDWITRKRRHLYGNPQMQVGVADATGCHLDQQFAGTGSGS